MFKIILLQYTITWRLAKVDIQTIELDLPVERRKPKSEPSLLWDSGDVTKYWR